MSQNIYLNVVDEDQASKIACCSNPMDFCLGSNCMAWRWQPLMVDDAFRAAVKLYREEEKVREAEAVKFVAENRGRFGLREKPYLGYCGLAGGVAYK